MSRDHFWRSISRGTNAEGAALSPLRSVRSWEREFLEGATGRPKVHRLQAQASMTVNTALAL